VAIGNSAIILGLLPVHAIWTLYSIARYLLLSETISALYNNTIVISFDVVEVFLFEISAKQLGPILKIFLCLCVPLGVILWLVVSILGSVLGGAIYGFLSPIFATFDAVGEGKSNPFFHCFYVSLFFSMSRSLCY